MPRIINARVEDSLADQLDAVAEYEGVKVAALVREAVTQLINSKKVDPDFKQKVIHSLERNQRLLHELGLHDEAAQYDLGDKPEASVQGARSPKPITPSRSGAARR